MGETKETEETNVSGEARGAEKNTVEYYVALPYEVVVKRGEGRKTGPAASKEFPEEDSLPANSS